MVTMMLIIMTMVTHDDGDHDDNDTVDNANDNANGLDIIIETRTLNDNSDHVATTHL